MPDRHASDPYFGSFAAARRLLIRAREEPNFAPGGARAAAKGKR